MPGMAQKRLVVLADCETASIVQAAASEFGLEAEATTTTEAALANIRRIGPKTLAGVVCELGSSKDNSCWPLLATLKSENKQAFVIVFGPAAAQDVQMRLKCFDSGAKMVTDSFEDVRIALRRVAAVSRIIGSYTCPNCGMSDLDENGLHLHMHMHHAVDPNTEGGACPICSQRTGNLEVHVHNHHGPPEEREPEPAHYAVFSWCVCRRSRDGKFLLVNEPAGISRGRPAYWLPAGRVDKGETLVEACRREALEEAGVAVQVTGILRFMVDGHGTLRIVFLSEPEDENVEPKSVPDWESVGAVWADAKDLERLTRSDYRSPDPAGLYPKVASGQLTPYSLDTVAFRNLEALMQKLTAGDRAALSELPAVWKQVEAAYPKAAFEK
eukprot:TRINITY_DN23676_c0_g2_i1.p1 TRINITY_DN23676_c0_g2~~TRINITY_DN23676_c0_g2_i1.p1  ORF type:complete len:384 (-),score=72.88 TRINITY_DN23676_c0_g2_i1:83-1234(-)